MRSFKYHLVTDFQNNFKPHGFELLEVTDMLTITKTLHRTLNNDPLPPLTIYPQLRPGTSDPAVYAEVLEKKTYVRSTPKVFDVFRGEHWLDLGANIGAFSLYCWTRYGTSDCYEPDPDCFELLKTNVGGLGGFNLYNTAVTCSDRENLPFFCGENIGGYDRCTIHETTRRHPRKFLKNVHISRILPRYFHPIHNPEGRKLSGIKMDIEGSEFDILDERLLPWADKLVLEYHFSRNPKMTDFRPRLAYLKEIYETVSYSTRLDKPYPNDEFPGKFDRTIFCWKRRTTTAASDWPGSEEREIGPRINGGL